MMIRIRRNLRTGFSRGSERLIASGSIGGIYRVNGLMMQYSKKKCDGE